MSETNRAGDLNARTDGDEPPTQKPDAVAIGEEELHIPEDDAVILTDGGTTFIRSNGGSRRFPELVDFRRDILLTLARSGATHGQGLKDDLSCLRDEDVNDGRLYPHLNALVDNELVVKRENEHDNRSHEFELSKRGRESVREHAQRVTGAVDALDGGAR